MIEVKDKKPMSKWTMVIVLSLLLSTSYYFGIVEGKNNGKIEMCDDMGGVYSINTMTREKGCFNASVLDTPGFDLKPMDIDLEVSP